MRKIKSLDKEIALRRDVDKVTMTDHQREWLLNKVETYAGISMKSGVRCPVCGKIRKWKDIPEYDPWSFGSKFKGYTCECGNRIEEVWSRSGLWQKKFGTIITEVDNKQALVTYMIRQKWSKDNHWMKEIHPVMMSLFEDDGTMHYYQANTQMMYNGDIDSFSLWSGLILRDIKKHRYNYNDYMMNDLINWRYENLRNVICPEIVWTKRLRKQDMLIGDCKYAMDYEYVIGEKLREITNEYLEKTKENGFNKLIKNRKGYIPVQQIKIAARQGYRPEDYRTWKENLQMLCYLGEDICNPNNICPKNLAEKHQELIEKMMQEEERERTMRERMAEEMRRNYEEQERYRHEMWERSTGDVVFERENMESETNKKYREDHEKYLDIKFSNHKYDAHVLQNVNEFFTEGRDMRQCLYTLNYYCKKTSIIVNIRDKNNEDVANAEIKTTNFSIVQIKGKNNINVDKEVEQFVEENIWRFREARDGKQELSYAS